MLEVDLGVPSATLDELLHLDPPFLQDSFDCLEVSVRLQHVAQLESSEITEGGYICRPIHD